MTMYVNKSEVTDNMQLIEHIIYWKSVFQTNKQTNKQTRGLFKVM